LLGTCTDANESIEATFEAKKTRHQLLSVLAHSHVTIFTIDLDRNITMLEGSLIWDINDEPSPSGSRGPPWYIGKNVYEVFNRLNSQVPIGHRPDFLQPIEYIIAGQLEEYLKDHEIGKPHVVR
jgi:hypothetical protein